MALTRKMLEDMGLTEEQVDSIIEGHNDTVKGLKKEIKSLNEQAEKVDGLEEEIETLKKDKETSEKEWKDKFDKEHKNFEDYKESVVGKELESKVKGAYRKKLKEKGINEKTIESILGVTDFKVMKVDAEGNLEDSDNLEKEIETKWGGFIPEEKISGAGNPKPPKNVGGKKYSSKEEIMKIEDTVERQQAIQNNPDLFE